MNPLNQTDFYKTSHYNMYPKGTSKIYSNFTPRKSRIAGVNHIVFFGFQYFLLEYLIKQWDANFFKRPKQEVIGEYKQLMDLTLGAGAVTTEHLEKLWDLGYMPLHIKALKEGTLCPIGIPCLTMTNTVGHAYWLVNYLETILSCTLWQPTTSATIAYEYKKLLTKHAIKTTGNSDGVLFQGHDFSMRGMSSLESAATSGAGHLVSFFGTDTVPAITFLMQYYGADPAKGMVGTSVPATEHSVMCMGLKDGELVTFERLLDLYPSGFLSVVSDTWDLWNVVKPGGLCAQLKDKIMARDGRLVIRPDSGDPVDIICGTGKDYQVGIVDREGKMHGDKHYSINEQKGVIELLWDTFGGTVNELGYKVLDPHVGAIYGDSITIDRARQICERLEAKGFASTNIVLGIGSYTYQYNTRDTFGFAMKATYGEVLEGCSENECVTANCTTTCDHMKAVGREIFKSPITDSGEKKSAKGLLAVHQNQQTGELELHQQCTKEEEQTGLLQTVFLDGQVTDFQTLEQVREKLASYSENLTVSEVK